MGSDNRGHDGKAAGEREESLTLEYALGAGFILLWLALCGTAWIVFG